MSYSGGNPLAELRAKEEALERERLARREQPWDLNPVGLGAAAFLGTLLVAVVFYSLRQPEDPQPPAAERPQAVAAPAPTVAAPAAAAPPAAAPVRSKPTPVTASGLQSLSANRKDWLAASGSERTATVKRVLSYMRSQGCRVKHSTDSYVRGVSNLYAEPATASVKVHEAIALIATGADDWQGC